MSDEQTETATMNEGDDSRWYMSDIVIEHGGEARGSWKFGGLCIFGIHDNREGVPYTLREASPGRWVRNGAIRISPEVEAIDFIVMNEEGGDAGFLHMESDILRVEGDHTQKVVTDPEVYLVMSWKIVSFFSDLPVTMEELEMSCGILHGRFQDCNVSLGLEGNDVQEVDVSVAVMSALLDATPEDSVDFPERLENLGTAFQIRFERNGDLDDATQAILHHQRAIGLRPDVPQWHSNLGNSFLMRYERTQTTRDLMEGYAAQLEAMKLLPHGHADKPRCYNDVGATIQLCFQAFGDPDHLDAAIDSHQLALELTPEGHPSLLAIFLNLGNGLDARFRHSGNRPDIDLAILAKENVVQLSPEGHRDLHQAYTSLGKSLLARFEHCGDLDDLDAAISAFESGSELTPEGHQDFPKNMGVLGDGIRRRALLAEHTGHGDFETSTCMYKRAAISGFGSPSTRLICARQWANSLFQHNPESPEMLHALDTTIQLVSLVAGLDMTMETRYAEIVGMSTITLEAAALACELGSPDRAIEWLEQGRCMVWGQLSALHTPLDNLHERDSILAQKFTELSSKLEKAGSWQEFFSLDSTRQEKISIDDKALAHSSLAKEWEKLLQRVRELEGFETFLRPLPSPSLLQHLPTSGPIVVINVDKLRCDAIALLNGLDEPLQIPLPNFSLQIAKQYHRDLSDRLVQLALCAREGEEDPCDGTLTRPLGLYRRKKGREESDVIRSILQGLWDFLVKPILDGLGFSKADPTSSMPLPRIWWCPTGPLSFLPIHAAGIYAKTESVCVLDYAVSSYTPTVTALITRVQNCLPIDEAVSGLLLTSHPDAIPHQRIPGAAREVDSIYTSATKNGARVARCEGDAVTVDEYLAKLESYSSVHLTCHASQSPGEPLESRFHLHNGTLNLRTIIERNLKNADLAFLSACQTSAGDELVSDEAVHLAAGMLAAGYRRVVATMWSIGDQHAELLANDFYQYLWEQRAEGTVVGFDGSLSAHALHHAVQQLRLRFDASEASLLSWIPYVHFGY